MSKAILTIDDIPQKVTAPMIDYLSEMNINAVMFAIGQDIEKNPEIIKYAIQRGFVIGNHSYSHPFFSKLDPEEGFGEIEKTEELIEIAHERAGVRRRAKLFRFPYLDKGGDYKSVFQRYLTDKGFNRIDDSDVDSSGYREREWNLDRDITCSFDCIEYRTHDGSISFDDVFKWMDEGDPDMGSNIFSDKGTHIILLHSHDESEQILPGYYKKMIAHMLQNGVNFVVPKFV